MIASLRGVFAARQTDARTIWRDAVTAHVAGKRIDIEKLREAGLEMGIRPPMVAAAFDGDCQAVADHRAAAAELEAVIKHQPDAAKRSAKAAARLAAMDAERVALIDEAGLEVGLAFEAARRRRDVLAVEERCPRMFSTAPAPTAAPNEQPDEPASQMAAVASPFDETGAGFIDD